MSPLAQFFSQMNTANLVLTVVEDNAIAPCSPKSAAKPRRRRGVAGMKKKSRWATDMEAPSKKSQHCCPAQPRRRISSETTAPLLSFNMDEMLLLSSEEEEEESNSSCAAPVKPQRRVSRDNNESLLSFSSTDENEPNASSSQKCLTAKSA